MNKQSNELHVIFGSGVLGKNAARELLRMGKSVRIVNRSGKVSGLADAIEVVKGDANDSALIEAAVQAGVSAYVVDGMQPHRLRPIIEVAIARFREFQALRDELQQTRNKLAERREIEKAKGILMKQKGMAEEEAYQALRKLAMDQGLKIGEVARQLISIAKLLG